MSAENFYSCQNLVYLIAQTTKESEINENHPKVKSKVFLFCLLRYIVKLAINQCVKLLLYYLKKKVSNCAGQFCHFNTKLQAFYDFFFVLNDHILSSQAVQVLFYNHMTKLANDSFKGCRIFFSFLPSCWNLQPLSLKVIKII